MNGSEGGSVPALHAPRGQLLAALAAGDASVGLVDIVPAGLPVVPDCDGLVVSALVLDPVPEVLVPVLLPAVVPAVLSGVSSRCWQALNETAAAKATALICAILRTFILNFLVRMLREGAASDCGSPRAAKGLAPWWAERSAGSMHA
ncbi:MAG TPA: hypothetical protein VGE16_16245 [Albitalea sp.]